MNMNPEKNIQTSDSLDKVNALRQEVLLTRLIEEERLEEKGKQESIAKQKAYQHEKDSLGAMVARRDELLKRQEEIAKFLDPEEDSGEAFSTEKPEWQDLPNQVKLLKQELQDIEALIPKKEKLIEQLFAQTKEGIDLKTKN